MIRLTRSQLATVFKDHETLRAFEQMATDVSETLPNASADAQTVAEQAAQRSAGAQGGVDRLAGVVSMLEAAFYQQRGDGARMHAIETRIGAIETALLIERGDKSRAQKLEARVADLETRILALQRFGDIDALRIKIQELQTLVQAS